MSAVDMSAIIHRRKETTTLINRKGYHCVHQQTKLTYVQSEANGG
jgi:hypothetical protein